jgi:hypothetical protein
MSEGNGTGGSRIRDLAIKSRLLYQLSYRPKRAEHLTRFASPWLYPPIHFAKSSRTAGKGPANAANGNFLIVTSGIACFGPCDGTRSPHKPTDI